MKRSFDVKVQSKNTILKNSFTVMTSSKSRPPQKYHGNLRLGLLKAVRDIRVYTLLILRFSV